MISTIGMLFLILALVFVLPTKYMVLTGLFINLLAMIWDWYAGRRNVTNWIVLFVNVLVCVTYYGFGLESFLPYMGNFFYGAIAIVSFGSAAIGRPFTLPAASTDPWERVFHRANVVVIGLFQVAALVLSLVLMPHVSYIVVPMLVSISSAGLSHRIVKHAMETRDRRRSASSPEGAR